MVAVRSPASAACAWDSFFFSSRRRHTRCYRDWSSDVCSSDLIPRCQQRTRSAGGRGTAEALGNRDLVLLALAVLAVISNWPRGVDYPWTGRPRIKEATGLSCHEGDARRSVATVQSPVASLVRTEWRGAENAAVAYG